MATDHNFKVKNGLTVLGDTLVVNHTGDVDGTQVYIKKKDASTNLMRWGEGTSGVTTYKWRMDQFYDFIGNNGSDVIVLKSSDGSIQGQSFKIGSSTVIGTDRDITINDKLTFSINSHYLQGGTNSLAFKNSSGSSYWVSNNENFFINTHVVLPTGKKIIFGGDDTYNAHLQYTDNGGGDHYLSVKTEHNDTITEKARFHAGNGNINVYGAFYTSGSATIGDGVNASLITRHIEGKHQSSNSLDTLYLNYSSTHNVQVGHSGNNNDLLVYGAVRTGNTARIDINGNLVNIGTINTGQGATEVYLMNQNVRSSDSPTFQDLTVQGNLNITGDINSYNVTDLDVVDKTITLGVGGTSNANNGGGIIIDGANAKLTWSDSSSRWTMNKSLQFSDTPTTTNQAMGIFFPGFDKEGTSDYTDNAKIIHTTNTGGHTGSVLLIESQNDANDGIAFVTPSSSRLKHNSNNIFTDAYHPNADTLTTARTIAGTSFDGSANIDISYDNLTNKPSNISNSDTVDGLHAASFIRSDADDTASGIYTFSRTSTTPVFNITGHAGASSYNYFMRAGNDTYSTAAVHFVNGSTRTADHGANAYVIRNDNGTFVLGKTSQSTKIYGSGDLTYNNNEVWHAGNDGSGSGLNADLLDGVHGGSFLRSDASDSGAGSAANYLSLGYLHNTKLLIAAGTTSFTDQYNNSPWYGIGRTNVAGYNGSGYNTAQMAFYWGLTLRTAQARIDLSPASNGPITFGNGGTSVFAKINSTGIYQGTSNLVWHAGNDGSGSGLDADTLDGINSGSLMRSDTADSFTAVPTFASGSSGTLASRTGFSDFLGYNSSYGSYIGGGVSNQGSKYIYAGGFMNDGGTVGTLWRSTNDGSGSGLDADLLDGLQGSSYWQKSGSWYGDLGSNGYDRVQGVNYTGGEFVLVEKNAQISTLVDGDYFAYESGGFFSSSSSAYGDLSGFKAYNTNTIQVQQKDGGNANLRVTGSITRAGNTVWDSANDGSGSGLDADTVDGLQASQFLRADNVTDTMDGDFGLGNRNGNGWSIHGSYFTQLLYAGNLHPGNAGYVFDPFRYKSTTLWGRSGSTWTNLGNANAILDGRFGAQFGGLNLSRSYDEFIIYFGNALGYTIANGLLIQHSTNGNSFDVYFETKESVTNAYESGFTTEFSQTGISSWPGGTVIRHNWAVGASYRDNLRIRIVPNWSTTYPNNTITIGALSSIAGYGSATPAFYTDFDKSFRVEGPELYANGSDKVWHAGNDGSGSGLDADTVDGIQGGSLLRSDASDTYNSTSTSHTIRFDTRSGELISDGGNTTNFPLEVHAPSSTDAAITFHVSNDYAFYFGLDHATNDLSYGGWSIGSTKNKIWTARNDGAGSGLDADLLDGQHGSYYLNYNNLTNKPTIPSSSSFVDLTSTQTITGTKTFDGSSSAPWRLHVSNASGSWDALTFQSTTEWGDSPQYGVLGGDGTEGLMLRRPHIVWSSAQSAADIRLGRSGGTSSGKWVGMGVKASNVGFLSMETTNVLTWDTSNNVNIPNGNLTRASNTVWDAGNDGSGSGLDADTVDGLNPNATAQGTTLASRDSSGDIHARLFRSNYATQTSNLGSGADIAFRNDTSDNYIRFVDGTRFVNWLGNHDGSGSGLDADLLDGTQKVNFVYGSGSRKTNNSNPNTALNSGFYDIYQTNAPTSTWYSYITMAHTNTANEHGHQIAGSFYSDGDIFNRHYDGTTASFGNWTRIWNAANDGSGSGLDADTLDGIQASGFGLVGGGTSYRPVTAGLYGTGHSSSILPIWQYNAANPGYGIGYEESSPDRLRMDVTNNLLSGTPDFELIPNELRINGNKVWNAGNDGSGSGLDADTLDGINSASFLRSDAADTGTTITLTDAIRTDRFEDQSGGFFFREGLNSGRHRHLNLADTTVDPASVSDSHNPTGISWGQRSDNNGYYMFGVKGSYNNGYSTHSRMAIGWHTGIEIGASSTYGGVRFMSDSPFVTTNQIFGIGDVAGGHSRIGTNKKLFFNGGSSTYGIGAGGHNYNSGYFDTLESGSSTDPLELVYYQGNRVNIGPSGGNKPLGCSQVIFGNTTSRSISHGTGHSNHNAVKITGNWNEFEVMGRVLDVTGSNCHFMDGYGSVNHASHYLAIGTGGGGNGGLSYVRIGTTLNVDGDVVAYYSDARLKQNVETIPNALEILKGIRGVTFEWNKKAESVWKKKEGDKDFGMIAQEVDAVFPMGTVVQGNADKNKEMGYADPNSPNYDPLHNGEKDEPEYKTIKYDKMVTLAIQAIKEQQEQIEELKQQIKDLQGQK